MSAFVDAGGVAAASVAEAIEGAEIVLNCLPGPDALAQVMEGTGRRGRQGA